VVEHWNGRTWTSVRLPSLPGPEGSGLSGVADISAADAWAVGSDGNAGLALHWNGKMAAGAGPGRRRQ
jgi:hypothetical protein